MPKVETYSTGPVEMEKKDMDVIADVAKALTTHGMLISRAANVHPRDFPLVLMAASADAIALICDMPGMDNEARMRMVDEFFMSLHSTLKANSVPISDKIQISKLNH